MDSEPNQNGPQRPPLVPLSKQHQQERTPSHWFAVLAFGVIALFIIFGGWWSFNSRKADIRRERQSELTAIATLKAQQISEWRKEKLKDAETLRSNRILSAQLSKWLEDGAPTDALFSKFITRLEDLQRAHDYHALLLLDSSANLLLQVGEKYGLDDHDRETALKAMTTQQSQFADSYNRHPESNAPDHHQNKPHVHLDLLIPLLMNDNGELQTVGAVLIRLDPAKFIFPLVETWPTNSHTAETILFKPTKTGVIRMSDWRHDPQGSFKIIKTPTDRLTPSVMIHNHQQGVVEHIDYRKVPALSVVRKIDGSPWYLVAKIDQAEIYAPIYRLARQNTLLVAAFIMFTGISMFYWWRQIRANYLASHYQSELDKQLLEQRFNALTKHANDTILLVNKDGQIVEANDRAAETFGYSREQLLELQISDLRIPEDRDLSIEQQQRLKQEGSLMFETLFLKRDGSRFPVEVSARLIELDGEYYFQGILRDISERKKAELQIKYLAHHDSLTGLPNRNLLQDRLSQNLAHARRSGSKSAILFLDFDRFKNINDSLGHSVGDGVLKEVAKRLTSCLREGDTVARVGGDEFIILMPDLENAKTAATVARKVVNLGGRPYEVEGQKFRLTISVGISLFPDDGDDIENLLKNADSAMYHAKKSGRNTFSFYTEDMNAQTLYALKLENDLQYALANDGLRLHYQPQVDLNTEKIIGAEALLRWEHPEHGNIPPSDFIPIAEERGLIVSIGDWVLETACRQSVAWQQQGLPPLRIAVNISALQLQHADFYERLAAILQNTGIAPELLELELTESAVMQSGEHAAVLLQQLKALGVGLAMDDFGTGYSSLSHLKKFPIDKLKIDRSFIKDLPRNTEDEAIAQAIIGIGRSLHHKVIAEGVETLEQKEFLKSKGCDEMQGFYFSRPISVDKFTALVKNKS